MGIRWGLVGLVLGGVAVVGAACTPAPRGGVQTPPAAAGARLSGPQCVVALSYQGVAFNRIADTWQGEGACGIRSAVSVVESPTPLNRAITVDCTLAAQLARYDREVLQPLALELFGQRLKTIHHYGGYVCRGRTTNQARLSEHAFGRAIDLGVFELEDGQKISVKQHWSGAGAKSTFLRRAAAGACSLFSVVLTPNSDRYHEDHFHLDVGPWTRCSI